MDVKQAVEAAKAYVPEAFAGEDVKEVRLEEVEFDEARDVWKITLGLMRPALDSRSGQVAAILGNTQYKRVYRVFSITDKTGEIKSIKMRQLEDA